MSEPEQPQFTSPQSPQQPNLPSAPLTPDQPNHLVSLPGIDSLLQAAWKTVAGRIFPLIAIALISSLLFLPINDTKSVSRQVKFDSYSPPGQTTISYPRILDLTPVGKAIDAWAEQNQAPTDWSLLVPAISWVTIAFLALLFLISLFDIAAYLIIMGKSNHPTPAFQLGLRYSPKYWWTMILSDLLILVGIILFIIPGIYLAIRLSFCNWIVLDQDLAGPAAIRQSFAYTKGRWWPIFWRLLAGSLIIGLTTLIISSVISGPLVVIDNLTNPLASLSVLGILSLLISRFISNFGSFYSQAYTYHLYTTAKEIPSPIPAAQ